MKHLKIANDYFKIVILNYLVFAILRLLETGLILSNFGSQESLFSSELFGFFYDLILSSTVLTVLFPLYFLIHRISVKLANSIFVFLITLLAVFHFVILKYFLYQLVPLDTSLYQYSIREILFTITTSGINYIKSILLLALVIVICLASNRLLKKLEYPKKLKKTIIIFILISLPAFVFIQLSDSIHLNRFVKNKPLYFYSRSISYFFNRNSAHDFYTNQDARDFQKLNPGKKYLSTKYPLLHEFNNSNALGAYFNKFDSAPNIVILIVEGLNDDFVHTYRGISVMPFLEKLRDKSLYWNKCFTLGERSFAVVPSLLGSLPYGEKGFTLLDNLPRHFSLVTVLKANGYYASFFYGQGSWFHRKDRFFNYNNADLIFDNRKFSEKYRKIIVGADHFFWGFNDKDLFNQSLEVIDTLPKKKRLDVYFTGTSHAPYVITDYEWYNNQMSKTLESLNSQDDIRFINTYRKYFLSISFVDEALKDFFNKYISRPEYENTIFIITGDHPTTEIPVGNSLKKYHVPFIIYSPKLKSGKTFTKVVSHLDFYESILSFLSGYNIQIPKVSTAIGSKLNVDESDRDVKIAFMNDNREIVDYYSNGYYLAGQQLYKAGSDLSITVSNDKMELEKLRNELKIFKKTSLHVSIEDKILPDSLYCKYLGYKARFSRQKTSDSIEFNSEFFDLVNPTAIQNKTIYFDISFNYPVSVDDNFTLVYQLSTKKDSVIFWGNTGINYEKQLFQAHIKIPGQHVSDSIVYFKSYFWNKNKQKFSFRDLKILLYERNSKF
jgi:phosphoglycerol transferase MdoB-like AlkP superfamily enzyme